MVVKTYLDQAEFVAMDPLIKQGWMSQLVELEC